MDTMGIGRNEALRTARKTVGMSQDDVARYLRETCHLHGSSKRQVQRWEAGEYTWPHRAYREALSTLFGLSPIELGFIPPADEDPMLRRRLLAAAAGITAAALSAEPYERLQAVLEHGPTRVTQDDAEELLGRASDLYAREASEPAVTLTPIATAHLNMLTGLLSVSGHTDRIRSTLMQAAATTALLLGWMHHNMADLATAEGYWTSAIEAGRACGDGPTVAAALAYRSYALSANAEHAAAWQLLDQAAAYVRSPASAQARSWLAARQAQEAAALGDHGPALISLERAMTAADYADPTTARPWVRFFDNARLGSFGVSVYGMMRHPQLQPAADAVMASVRDDRPKTKAVVMAEVAGARLEAGDLDAGCQAVRDSLAVAVPGEAPLAHRRLRTLMPVLDRHRDASPVRALLPTLSAALAPTTA